MPFACVGIFKWISTMGVRVLLAVVAIIVGEG